MQTNSDGASTPPWLSTASPVERASSGKRENLGSVLGDVAREEQGSKQARVGMVTLELRGGTFRATQDCRLPNGW